MTTEQTLRDALAEIGGMVAALLAAESGGALLCADMIRALTSAEMEARRAISLPPSETREEWRIASLKMEDLPNPDHWVLVHGRKLWKESETVTCESRVRIVGGQVIGETRGKYFAVIVSHWMNIPTSPAIPAFDPAEPKMAKSIP